MRETLTSYFAAERFQGFFWLGVGVVLLAVGAWLLLGRSEYRHAGWPLGILALVEIAVGVTTIFNDGRVAGLLEKLAQGETALASAEAARMQGMAVAFVVMKIVEASFFVSGAVMVLTVPARSAWYAVAVGLIIQGGAALTLESIAARRNANYRAAVEAIAAGTDGSATLE